MDDLGLCVKGKDASQERTITDPILSSTEEKGRKRLPNAWWNFTVFEIISFTTRSLCQTVSEKWQDAEPAHAISDLHRINSFILVKQKRVTQSCDLYRFGLDGTIKILELQESFCPAQLETRLLTGDSSPDLPLFREAAQPASESR